MSGLSWGLFWSSAFFALKIVFKVFLMILKFLARLIVFFGLYFPLFYSFTVLSLMASGHLNLAEKNTAFTLTIIGFMLSLVCAIIVSIRNCILKPMLFVFDFNAQRKKIKEDKLIRKENVRVAQNPHYRPNMPQRPVYPIVYRSRLNPKIVIREYYDYYKIYKTMDDGFYLIDIKKKYL